MRKTFLISSTIFAFIGIIFSIVPLGIFSILINLIPVILGYLAYKKSSDSDKKMPLYVIIIAGLSLIFSIGRTVLVEDAVTNDATFEKTKEESKKEAQKDLEELENL